MTFHALKVVVFQSRSAGFWGVCRTYSRHGGPYRKDETGMDPATLLGRATNGPWMAAGGPPLPGAAPRHPARQRAALPRLRSRASAAKPTPGDIEDKLGPDCPGG